MREDSAFTINHALRTKGLASLEQAGALIPQLAMFVRGHDHFRALLNACEPENRRAMYDSLAPNLRFKARPLATYMIELAQDAERRQLPTVDAAGKFQPFKVAEIHTEPKSDAAIAELKTANNAVAEAVAKQHLHVVCAKCTREEVFHGVTKQDAVDALRSAGWTRGVRWYRDTAEPTEICPECTL